MFGRKIVKKKSTLQLPLGMKLRRNLADKFLSNKLSAHELRELAEDCSLLWFISMIMCFLGHASSHNGKFIYLFYCNLFLIDLHQVAMQMLGMSLTWQLWAKGIDGEETSQEI